MADQDGNSANELREYVKAKSQCLEDNDLYKLFDLEPLAPSSAVRDAYFKLAKKLHPDAIAREGIEDMEAAAVNLFKGIANAYRILSDPKKKAEYDADFARAAGVSMTPTQAKTKKDLENEARMHFHKASLLMKRGAWEDAAAALRKAIDIEPTNSEYLCALGWSVMQNDRLPPSRALEEARGWFEKAINSDKPTADAHYHMSLYYKAVGDIQKQRMAIQDALMLSPDHICAQRERRLLNMRMQNQKPDLFASVRKWFEKQKGGTGKKKR